MFIRVAWSVGAAVLISCGVVAAQDDDEFDVEEAPISVVGCIQREVDYRRENDSGRGGFLGFGGGLGDEYVLVNAGPGSSAPGDCTTATGGEAYELTGSAEDDLEPFVGQRVAISGIRKEAEVDAATGRPTGGRQAGDDLKLFEVEVESFRALTAPVQTDIVARADQPERDLDQDVAGDRDREPTAVDDRDVRTDDDRLPRTASPLALMGLLGLTSLGGLAGLRALYRHERRNSR